ncbi:hypothetical protein ACS0TY_013805 [Phlomoides rotata]
MAGDRETSQQSVGKRGKGLISMSTPPIDPGSTTAPISPINLGSMASPTVGGMAGPTLSSNPGSTTFPTMGALEVLSDSAEVKVNALTNGLRDGDLFSSLAKKPIQTFDELLHMAEKYITLEEVRKTRKSEVRSLPYDK